MKNLIIPEHYRSSLDLRKTAFAIKTVKDLFQTELARALHLTRVSAPLFVSADSGLNDNLNGVERPVRFDLKEMPGEEVEIVHSLAKWKRYALKRYGFSAGEGLYTDMNAIRRDETADNIHSIYVDQWDWEKIIDQKDRNLDFLKETVRTIYAVLKKAENDICATFGLHDRFLPAEITFITSQELEDRYPNLDAKGREYEAVKQYGAIFVIGIGKKLKSGKPHDGRAPDYDDWDLNGDIIVYYPVLDIPLELSSMGIRVSEESLKKQLDLAGCPERAELPFQKALLAGELPYTIGGGIGQSRICMFLLRKAHIGEVHCSIWPDEMVKNCEEAGIRLL